MITIDDHCHCQHDHDHHDSGECVLCERPRVLCVVGEVWDRMGADSKVLGGSARAHFPNIRISSSKHHNFHKIIIAVLEYTNTQMMTYYYILLLYIAYYFY